jgi:hypothetical protein
MVLIGRSRHLADHSIGRSTAVVPPGDYWDDKSAGKIEPQHIGPRGMDFY